MRRTLGTPAPEGSSPRSARRRRRRRSRQLGTNGWIRGGRYSYLGADGRNTLPGRGPEIYALLKSAIPAAQYMLEAKLPVKLWAAVEEPALLLVIWGRDENAVEVTPIA
jgi:hypothetical protein